MAPRGSRSKAASAPDTTATPTIGPSDDTPPQLFVLPDACSPDASFVSLRKPATDSLTRYLYCPKTGFHELTRVGGNASALQSCLLAPSPLGSNDGTIANGLPADDTANDRSLASGYVLQSAQLLVVTAYDPTFFLLPLFKPSLGYDASSRSQLARTAEDYLDDLAQTSTHMRQLLRQSKVRALLTRHLERVCDRMDVAEETAYKFNYERFTGSLLSKARNVVDKAWPKSLEEHVQKQLEMPVAAQVVESQAESDETMAGSDMPIAVQVESNGDDTSPGTMNGDRKAAPNGLTPVTSIEHKLRLRTALSFIISSYLSRDWRTFIEETIAKNQVYDFSDLDNHLQAVKKAKSDALATRSFADNISRKRSNVEDEEANEARAEKKRKKEEEEKKRKAESRATRDLKKVNTTGMKKMSSFFTKQSSTAQG